MKLNFTLAFAMLLTLTGCAGKQKIDKFEKLEPAQALYDEGLKAIELEEYPTAIAKFEQVFFQHPGNKITPKAEIKQAYAHFLNRDYNDTIDVLELFIKLHPRHEEIAYAYYLKALSYYAQISSAELDQSKTINAKKSFEELMNRFPKSKHSRDAALKLDLINDHLAGKEISVARFYLHKNNPIAAINRLETVIKEYDTTSHAPEALYRLVESNLILGLRAEAEKYASILGHNYPKNKWYRKSYQLLKN